MSATRRFRKIEVVRPAVRHRRQLFGCALPIARELGITCPFAAVLRTLAVTGFGKLE